MLLVLLLIVLVFLSAFFSSAETAFSSVNQIRLKNYVEQKRTGSVKALYIAENFDRALSTILVGNNIVNISAATISAKLATDIFGATIGLPLSTFAMTVIILIFGEILPKSFAKEHAEQLALQIAGILLFLMKVLSPIIWFFVKLKVLLSKVIKQKNDLPTYTEEEIKELLNLSEAEGVIDRKENELVHRSLSFNDISVNQIFVSRINVIAIDINHPIEEIKQIFLKERYSRIPIYEEHVDNIIGILSEREFLGKMLQNDELNIRDLLRKPIFVIETLKIADLLPELQKNKTHMAIVIDEFGGTAGIITMEDILEELVGEILDEHDEKISYMNQIDRDNYEFFAEVPLRDFAKILKIPTLNSSYQTLGGWVIEKFEQVPNYGDQFQYEHLTIIINEMENRRVKKVLVKLNQKQ
ncbi:hemolysin family protein [Anaerobacillus isosaccharinicus]|uniref:HlyC/CorC family transporter n=1 Tax=Anaerobacillus isosaccharinicus TaxID=1532552 RepID=A0A1S2L8T1_9BACI|nr:hemolysin family protein [Anaerobacillus isosaccharinicus]MBA5588628.1 HlyC/CorC family transporter [Anaerobacillus isosaccharinicus]QOY37961.1 HlyC/CorC family transporter [Anaerobacillus isosaccharinicus]